MNAPLIQRRLNLDSGSDRDRIEKRIANKDWPRVTYDVTRDGQAVERFGMVTRITHNLIWISCFVYTHSEVRNMVEVD